MRHIFYPLLIATVGLFPNLVTAETLELSDGTTITGEIKNIGIKDIVISTIVGDITLERKNIVKTFDIESAPAPSNSSSGHPTIKEKEQFAAAIFDSNMFNVLNKYPDGVMLGYTLGHGFGMFVAYDHFFSVKTELHIQYDANSRVFHERNLSEHSKDVFAFMDISTHKIMATYRYFPYTASGLYIGAGGGMSYSTFTLDRINSYDSSDPAKPISATYDYNYHSYKHGAFIVGELGFQSRTISAYNKFYVHVGLQLAKYIYTQDSFDINDLLASPYANEIINLHEEQKNISQLVAGFGFYF